MYLTRYLKNMKLRLMQSLSTGTTYLYGRFSKRYQIKKTSGRQFRLKAELRARVGRPQTSSSPPVIFIAGRPKAALLFWFFGDFRCGALLFMVIHVIYKYKNK